MSSEIRIDIDDATAQGVYSNLALISHSDSDFTLDFVYVQPQGGKARLRSRVILTPQHAKRFIAALGENIRKFEQAGGEIKLPAAAGAAERKIGF